MTRLHISAGFKMIAGLIHWYEVKRKNLCRRFVLLMVTVPIRRRIAKYLRARRLEAGFTVEEAARKIGVPKRVIRSTERAWFSIPMCMMTDLIEGYGADRVSYALFINRLGVVIYRRKRALETKCGHIK